MNTMNSLTLFLAGLHSRMKSDQKKIEANEAIIKRNRKKIRLLNAQIKDYQAILDGKGGLL